MRNRLLPVLFLGPIGLGLLSQAPALFPSSEREPPAAAGVALAAPEEPDAKGLTIVGPELLEPVLPLSAAAQSALGDRKHKAAVAALEAIPKTSLHGHQVDDLAFVLAWERLRLGTPAKSIVDIEVVRRSDHAPPDYLHLTLGELLLEDGKAIEAVAELEQVSPDAVIWPRARLRLAEAHDLAGATAKGQAVRTELIDRPDPAEGSEHALWALVNKVGADNPTARPWLVRLSSRYPLTGPGRQATRVLDAQGVTLSAVDLAWRADSLMDAGAVQAASDLVGANTGRFVNPTADSCMAWYAQGRSHFKRNNVTLAAEILTRAGDRCVGVDEDRGAKSLYIAGKSLERKKEWVAAAQAFEKIPKLYPAHSMADDGFALAGVAWQIAGKDDVALERWQAQVAAYPDGDLAGEGFWRLAWTAYKQGQPEEAIRLAERMIWEVPMEADPVHVMAAHYWAARWRVYPDAAAPTVKNTDAAVVAQGLALWERMAKDHPTRFYSILAAARLHELAPERVKALSRPTPSAGAPGTWTVRQAFLDEPATGRAVELARLGLIREAQAELKSLPEADLSPSEVALQAELAALADPIEAHDRLHHYLLHHPPSTLGADRDNILRLAYPNLFWDEVQEANAGADFPVRVFHALVREESSFNKDNVSWAGARGLSQLMPATAKEVGRRIGITVNSTNIFDPLTNLKIGGTYLDSMFKRYDGNAFLAVPSYNAGPGNVDKWVVANDGRPTDEFVESIPIRETRHYVKRVLGTYQLYRVLYEDGPVYPDWSSTNHVAKKAG